MPLVCTQDQHLLLLRCWRVFKWFGVMLQLLPQLWKLLQDRSFSLLWYEVACLVYAHSALKPNHHINTSSWRRGHISKSTLLFFQSYFEHVNEVHSVCSCMHLGTMIFYIFSRVMHSCLFDFTLLASFSFFVKMHFHLR
jgi:hypothetical protein